MRDEALCFSREIRWMFVAVHLRPPRNNKIYLNPSWMESCNGHKHKIPPYFQTLIPIKMHEVRRSGDNGGHNIHCDLVCQDSGQDRLRCPEPRLGVRDRDSNHRSRSQHSVTLEWSQSSQAPGSERTSLV